MKEHKRLNIKFYDLSLHTKLKIQAAKENTTMQELIIRLCEEYLEKVEESKNNK